MSLCHRAVLITGRLPEIAPIASALAKVLYGYNFKSLIVPFLTTEGLRCLTMLYRAGHFCAKLLPQNSQVRTPFGHCGTLDRVLKHSLPLMLCFVGRPTSALWPRLWKCFNELNKSSCHVLNIESLTRIIYNLKGVMSILLIPLILLNFVRAVKFKKFNKTKLKFFLLRRKLGSGPRVS